MSSYPDIRVIPAPHRAGGDAARRAHRIIERVRANMEGQSVSKVVVCLTATLNAEGFDAAGGDLREVAEWISRGGPTDDEIGKPSRSPNAAA